MLLPADTQNFILDEIREFRTDYNKHARETGERLSSLEAQMYSLCGNGQPGRIATLEKSVQQLKAWRGWLVGAWAGVSGAGSLLAWAWLAFHRK